MSEENLVQALEALDQRVEELVNTISDLRHERDVLRLEVEESNKAREELDTQLHSLNGNKNEIKNRIASIIEKINAVQTES
jgi:chromosome segregation ATPase